MKFLRISEVQELTGLRPSTIWEKIAEGTFPRQVHPSPRVAAWIEDEITAWQKTRIAARDATEKACA